MFSYRRRMEDVLIPWQILLGTATLFLMASTSAYEKSDSSYEIVSHHARIHLFPETQDVQSVDTLAIRLSGEPAVLGLKLPPVYKIEYLTINGEETKFHHDGIALNIDDIPTDSVLQVVIGYSGRFLLRSEFSSITAERAIFRDAEILPTGISRLQNIRLSVTVPSNWETVAGGVLSNVYTGVDSSTYVWEMDQPVSEIGWICAGKFSHYDRSDGKTAVAFRLFEEDSISAHAIYPLIREVIKFYSDKYSSYRFSKLSIVEIEDWIAGRNVLAIASPSVIMVKKLAFTTNDQFNKVESIIAHEIAHQWFPLTVFIDDQDAAFLAEGMCEYSSILFNEMHGTMSRRDSLSRHPLLRPLLMRVQQGKDVPLQQRADLRSMVTQYLKASYVHNMLRLLIGDSGFLQLYRQYVERFTLKKVRLTDFQNVAEELYGQKLGWFFKQWILERGIPRLKMYNVKSIRQTNGWRTRGRVRIVGYEKFTLSGTIDAVTSKGNVTTGFKLGLDSAGIYHNDAPFEITSDDKPDKIVLDPKGDLLKVQKLPPKLSDLREPAYGVMIVGSGEGNEYLIRLAQKDSIQLVRSGWEIAIKSDTGVTLSDLQNERVILYGRAADNRVVADLEKKFPLGFTGDSLKIGEEKIFDSTLTLIEVIDNPYIDNGLLIRISPMTGKANPEFLPYDASWIVIRGKDEIKSGTWDVNDEDLVVEIK